MAEKSDSDDFRWLEVDVSDVVFLIRRHLGKLVGIPLAFAVLGFVVTRLLPPVFSTSAEIYLRPNFDKEMQLERTYSKLDDADSLRSIEKALVADSVVLAMVDRLGLRGDAGFLGEKVAPKTPLGDAKLLREVRDRYAADLMPNTRSVILTVDDYDAGRTVEIANTLIAEFLERFRIDRNGKEAELRASLIGQSRKALEGALAMEEKLTQFRSEHPDTLVEQDSSIFHDRLLASGEALNEANSEVSRLAGMLNVLESVDPETDPFRVFQIVSNRNREYLSELMGMHADAKAEMAAIAQRRQAKHLEYQEAASRLEEVEATLRRYAIEVKNGVASEYEAATEKVVKLNETLSDLHDDFVGLKTKSAEFRGLKEEMDRNWNTYTRLQQKVMDLDLDPEVSPTFITVVSDPVVPDKKASPRGLYFAAGGGLLGVLVAIGLVFWPHRFGLPFTGQDQVQRLLGLPVIGSVELQGAGKAPASGDILNLLISTRETQVVGVMTLGERDQFDTIPWSLAMHSAAYGAPTLYVTVDPHLANPDTVRSSGTPNLFTLRLPLDCLMNRERCREGLEVLRGSFQRIILDTSMLPSWEAKAASVTFADRSLLAIRSEAGPRQHYAGFLGRCRESGGKPLAAIYVQVAKRKAVRSTGKKGALRLPVPAGATRRHHLPGQRKPLRQLWSSLRS